MKTVSLEQVGREELALPARVQEALGELVGQGVGGASANTSVTAHGPAPSSSSSSNRRRSE
jgi:hypothetical protein